VIYGKNFNIIHMPKTGGTWIRRVCDRLPRDSRAVRKVYPHHMPASGLTPAEAKLPTYVLVRNPWDWYVSLYGHWHGNIVRKRHEFRLPYKRLRPEWQDVYDRFSGTFEEAMRPFAECKIPRDPHTGNHYESMSDIFSKFTEREEEYDLRVLRFEDSPRQGFLRILRETCPEEITPSVSRLVDTHQRENASDRGHYSQYYRKKGLKELVEQLDAPLIEKFGYSFGP
jgi:hypothetical protein